MWHALEPVLLVEETGLPFSGLSLDDHDLPSTRLCAPPCAGEFRELCRPAHERRTRACCCGRADHPPPDPRLPDSLREAQRLGTRLGPERRAQRSGQVFGQAQSARPVARERQRAHGGARRRLGGPIEHHRPQGRLRRRGRVAPFELRGSASLQRLEPARAP